MRRMVALVFVVAACGGSLRGKADDLYDAGRFQEAAELYDQIVRANPSDREALDRRTSARNGALRVQLAYVTKVRHAGNVELSALQLAKLFELRDAWQMNPEPAIVALVAQEVDATGGYLASVVGNRVRTAGPLVGEKIALTFSSMLAHPEFVGYRTRIEGDILAAGRDACARLGAGATTPYWTWIVARYCGHFGARAPEVPVLPNLVAGVTVAGEIGGAASEESTRMRDALGDAFRASVWYAPGGAAPVSASLQGSLSSTFGSVDVTKYAEYTEEIPYTAYEDEQESYQEPYDDTEYYSEDVPYTAYESESYSCGSSTCTRSVPVTKYRSESRTRTVTKYRTAYRTVTKPVTRYRTEYRTFDYAAIERSGRYRSDVRVTLGGALPLTAASVEDFTQTGIDHDATFSPAGVYPQRANLLSAEDFVVRAQQRLAADLRTKLDALYAQRFCQKSTYSLEDAATCAYLDAAQAPPLARSMLRAQFGEDETLLATVLGR